MFLKVDVNVRIKDNDIDDIMYTALNGGITYWCYEVGVVGKYLGKYASEQISRGGELKLYIEDEEEPYTLDKDKFVSGLSKYLSEYGGFSFNERTCIAEIDTEDIDAEAADMIIQYAIFGQIDYA